MSKSINSIGEKLQDAKRLISESIAELKEWKNEEANQQFEDRTNVVIDSLDDMTTKLLENIEELNNFDQEKEETD